MKSFASRARVPAAVAVAVLVAGLAGATPAQATVNACTDYNFYSTTSGGTYRMPAAGAYFKDGPGGATTVSVTTATTISASGTVSAGATISGIVAQAKIDISATIGTSTAITTGHSYYHAITAGKYGNFQYGSDGFLVVWKYWYRTPQCTNVLESSGTAKTPTTSVGWKYWETTS